MTKLEYLENKRDMDYHNLLCFSRNYSMTLPKCGYEKEFEEQKEVCSIVEELIAEEKGETGKPLVGVFIVNEKVREEWRNVIKVLEEMLKL